MCRTSGGGLRAGALAVPAADTPQQHDRRDGHDGEPCQAALPARQDDEGRQQRTECRAGVAAHLEERLRQSMLPTRCQTRNPRRLGMEDRRADPDQPSREQHERILRGPREQQQPAQTERHPDRERLRLRPPIRVVAHERLQQRRRHLVHERDEPNMTEVEAERALEDRIDRRQQRLHHVVQQVAEAERTEHRERSLAVRATRGLRRVGGDRRRGGVARCRDRGQDLHDIMHVGGRRACRGRLTRATGGMGPVRARDAKE